MSVILRSAILIAGLLTFGCATPESSSDDQLSVSLAAITDGLPASDYPEAALVNIDPGPEGMKVCSGALIAPNAVLTAGHCLDGHTSFELHVGGEFRRTTEAVVFDWYDNGSKVNPEHHDVGLLFFETPIVLDQYPTLALAPLPDQSPVTCVGRVLDGRITSELHQTTTQVSSAASIGFPYDYVSPVVTQRGDSGGPVYAGDSHQIVAVSSGAGSGIQVMARVDLLASWIAEELAARPVTTSEPEPSATTQPDPTEECAPETEGNDTLDTATVTTSPVCGALSGTDRDFYRIALEPGQHTLRLESSDDAVMSVGLIAGNECVVAHRHVRSMTARISGGTAQLCVLVTSPSESTQSYRIGEL
jgi:hypothetical protein